MTFLPAPITGTLDELTPQQRDFVLAVVESGGRRDDVVNAALAAGYGRGRREVAAKHARELLRNPRVLAALRTEIKKRFDAASVIGLQTMIDLCESARSEQVRLAAARELEDRGYGPVISKSAVVSATTSVEDLLARLDAQEAAARGDVIDGKAVEVLADARQQGSPPDEADYDERDSASDDWQE
jgi:phage terminase small subunit